jgi:hypothetical protein
MGVIYGSGIYFILGWDASVSEAEAVSRLNNLCQYIGNDEAERCWKCAGAPNCIVKDDSFNMHIKFEDKVTEDDFRFDNIELKFDSMLGWLVEYSADNSEIYMMRSRSEYSMAERIAMWKVAQHVSDQLGMTDSTLRPIPYADVWNV